MTKTISAKLARESNYTTMLFAREPAKAQELVLRDIEPKDYVADLYHPGKGEFGTYRPGNELASEYTALKVLWTNFSTLFEQAKSASDEYTRKLLLKSAATELRSFLDAQPRLVTLVSAVAEHDGSQPRTFVCLTAEERSRFEDKARSLSKCKGRLLKTLTSLRNHLGAHMSRPLLNGSVSVKPKEELPWQKMEELWQSLEPRMFIEMAVAAAAFLESARHLPVYEFYRYESPTRLRIHIPAVAVEDGTDLRFNALSPSPLRQIQQFDGDAVQGTSVILRREPVQLKVAWPKELLENHPQPDGSYLEL